MSRLMSIRTVFRVKLSGGTVDAGNRERKDAPALRILYLRGEMRRAMRDPKNKLAPHLHAGSDSRCVKDAAPYGSLDASFVYIIN
jgi:hypothetical protein